ncbi:MAG TPA: cytochrome b N-terminal domain-containing protein, partial [Chroococcales cyanobacterium]
ELNWITGVILLFCTLAMGFTGQVLRWDQTSVWTVAVGAEQAFRMPYIGKYLVQLMVSGGAIGSGTLSHFFALHVFVFPAILIGMLGLHLWLVLHNGISEPPKLGEPVDPPTYRQKYADLLKREGRPFWPHAAWRDLVFSTLIVATILALSLAVGPPHVERPPDPSLIQAEPRPDWYLVWYFALLALLPHKAEDWVIILFPLLLLGSLLALPLISNKGERSLRRRPWEIGIVVFALAAIGALTIEGFQQPWTPAFKPTPLTEKVIGASQGPIYEGAQVFSDRGCLYCHSISGHGGKRGPDLTTVANRLTADQITIKIVNGGYNMPAYAGNITPEELKSLTAFLESRTEK